MFTRLLTEIRVARDDFKKRVDLITNEKKEALAVIKNDYVAGSKSALSKQEEIEKTFSAKLDSVRDEAADYIGEHFASVEEKETERLKNIDSLTLQSIEHLENIPVSLQELKVLNDTFGKNKNYWVEKKLLEIAIKNGISDKSLGLEASFEEKLAILSELKEEFFAMIAEYDGEATVKNTMFLHDTRLTKWEIRYKNGLNNIGMSAENIALHAFAMYSQKANILEKSQVVSNVLKNSEASVKNEFMYLLAKDGGAYQEEIKRFNAEYSKFVDKDFSEYEKAKEAINKIKNTNNVEKSVLGLENNKFIAGMLEGIKKDYSSVRVYLGEEETKEE